MQDAALRRRIAALVLAALLAMSGAALTTAYFADDAQAQSDEVGDIFKGGKAYDV